MTTQHEPGCDEQHTSRQRCNQNAARYAESRDAPMPMAVMEQEAAEAHGGRSDAQRVKRGGERIGGRADETVGGQLDAEVAESADAPLEEIFVPAPNASSSDAIVVAETVVEDVTIPHVDIDASAPPRTYEATPSPSYMSDTTWEVEGDEGSGRSGIMLLAGGFAAMAFLVLMLRMLRGGSKSDDDAEA